MNQAFVLISGVIVMSGSETEEYNRRRKAAGLSEVDTTDTDEPINRRLGDGQSLCLSVVRNGRRR